MSDQLHVRVSCIEGNAHTYTNVSFESLEHNTSQHLYSIRLYHKMQVTKQADQAPALSSRTCEALADVEEGLAL